MKEPLLEPVLRKLRIRRVLPTLRRYPDCCLLDVGCGRNHLLLDSVAPFVARGVGIDYKVPEMEFGKIKTIRLMLADVLPFPAESFDVVTMLAVLEHLAAPVVLLKEIQRILKKEGRLVLTVPGKAARPVLEFLAYRLKIISAGEIREHKKYYDRAELEELFSQCGMVIERHEYFQFGMNNFCIVKKMP
ncbi:MAG TPA: class I SAM-dependent methyltransferase [Smithellaceae bacterium]|nr:class I SAM-dependent methyltransferase [Smithellaceae bacterium]